MHLSCWHKLKAGFPAFWCPGFLLPASATRYGLQRLKNKLGNKSNASSEIELEGAQGWLLNEEGRGVGDHH